MIKKTVTAVMSKGPVIGRKTVELSVDMSRQTFMVDIVGTGTTIKLSPQDVAAVLNEAVKEVIAENERISQTDNDAQGRL